MILLSLSAKTLIHAFFFFASLFAFAGEKKPELKVTSTGEYLIIVDGKQYKNEKKILVKDMNQGIHYIDVFRKKKGLFGSKYKLVSSKQFEIGRKDLSRLYHHW